jgi:hypothetical protein
MIGGNAWPSFVRTFWQVFHGTVDISTAKAACARLLSLSPWLCAGVLASKNAAFNLLPLLPLPGGLAVAETLSPSNLEEAPPWKSFLLNVSVLIVLAIYSRWLWALWSAL